MATRVPPFPPVRPMDPAFMNKFIARKPLDKKTFKAFIKLLNAYNKKCQRAAKDFEKGLLKI